MNTIFTKMDESSKVNITDEDDNNNRNPNEPRFNENDQVITKIVDAFYAGAKVTIAGTALITMNEQTGGAVLSAINMVAGAANKMFETSASSVPTVIHTLSMTANGMVESSINECASQLYQTGAAFLTIFNGMLNYVPDLVRAMVDVGAVAVKAGVSAGIGAGVIALNRFRQLNQEDKKRYLRQYLATVLNGIVDVHKQSLKLGKDMVEGMSCANKLNTMQQLETNIGNLTSKELNDIVRHVIPYMRSAEYNLSQEDLSFMAGNPDPFDSSNLEFRLARKVQNAIELLENDKLFLEEEYGSDSDDDANEQIIKRQKTSHFSDNNADKVLRHINRMLYLLNELDCSSCGLQRIHSYTSAYPTQKSNVKEPTSFSQPGGKKSKRTKKRKPVIRRKQTKRVQRKQTKRLQKKLRKKQTKK
jgi:hypothetical protein